MSLSPVMLLGVIVAAGIADVSTSRAAASVPSTTEATLSIGCLHLSRQKSARSHCEWSRAVCRRLASFTSLEAHSRFASRFDVSTVHRRSIVVAETSRCAVSIVRSVRWFSSIDLVRKSQTGQPELAQLTVLKGGDVVCKQGCGIAE